MKTILYKEYPHHSVISLNRPDVRNAFHPDMIAELTEVFTHLVPKSSARAVLLRGEGKSFCSGADLSWMQAMVGYSLNENKRDSEFLWQMFAAIRECPVPVVGRIHGHAIGGGVGLAAVCDIAVAVTDTVFAFSEARLGLVPAVISSFVLEKMQAGQARRLMLSAENFSGSEALSSGLIEFAGSVEQVDGFCQRTLVQLIGLGPEAVRATKSLLRELPGLAGGVGLVGAAVKARTTQVISERRVGAEGQEGLKSFLEKREAKWRVKVQRVELEAR